MKILVRTGDQIGPQASVGGGDRHFEKVDLRKLTFKNNFKIAVVEILWEAGQKGML